MSDLIKRQDAIEVVRCKDCKHYNIPIGEDGWTVCPMNIAEQPNAFCSRGERREERQTEYKLPFEDEIMERLDKLTLKGGGDNDGER